MMKRLIHYTTMLIAALCLSATLAQAQQQGSRNKNSDKSTAARMPKPFALMPSRRNPASAAAPLSVMPMAWTNVPVLGNGTVGRLTRWTGLNSSNSFLGDSTIFENKDGLVGIGTESPKAQP